MHRLLQRQIKRYLGSVSALEALPEEMKALLAAVDQAYAQADDDRNMIEHSADLMARELNQANEQLRSSIPDLFLRLTLDGTIVDYQAGCLGETNDTYLSEANPRGTNLWQQLPTSAVESLKAAINRAHRENIAVAVEHTLEYQQQVVFYEARVLRVVAGHAIMIVRNITERKQAEALRASEEKLRQQSQELQSTITALQKSQAQLIQQAKMSSLGHLVAGIAHEINNPLAFIFGNLSNLNNYISQLIELIRLYQASYPKPEAKIVNRIEEIDLSFLIADLPKLLQSLHNGAKRISTVIKSLRTFSRLDEASLKVVDLHENLASVLMILQYRYSPHRPRIEVAYRPQSLPKVECFVGQINQVFLNLAINGFDAIEARLANDQTAGQTTSADPADLVNQSEVAIGCLEISTRYDETNDQVIITFADNGIGIPQNVSDRIFDPFFTTKPIGQGMGMGLAVVHQVVIDHHHGQLHYLPQPDGGTVFEIALPVHLSKEGRKDVNL